MNQHNLYILFPIVYGFTQSTLVAHERPEPYNITIEVTKGFAEHALSVRNLRYRVSVSPDSTAG